MKRFTAVSLFCCLVCGFLSSCVIHIRRNEQNPLTDGGAYVHIRENTKKITRDEELTFDGSEKLEISLARNEAEGAQFVFRRENSDTMALSVSVSELVCAETGAKLTSSDITVYRQRYHRIDKTFDTQALSEGYYPDALLDLKTADNSVFVEAGKNQGYWITVRAGNSTHAGIYKGSVTVAFDDGEIIVPFECEVWDFAISETNHLGTSFGVYYLDKYSGQTLEYYEKLLNEYRICGTFMPYGSSITADYWQNIKNEKITDATWWYRPSYDPASGQVNITSEEKNLYSLMKNEGWLDKIHTSLKYDEPKSNEYEQIGIYARAVKREMPGLKVLITSTSGIPYSLADCVDWCVKPDAVTKEEVISQHNKGLEVWWYTCNFPVYPAPSMHINDYQVSARITGIMADDYGIDGFLYWDVTNDRKYLPDENGKYSYTYIRNTYDDVYVCEEWPAGDGTLAYQGIRGDGEINANTLVPSLRLEAFRDGMEDYEYLYLLREKYSVIAEKLGISVDMHDLLSIFYDNLYKSSSEYFSDGTRLTETRKQIAAAILSDDELLVGVVREGGQYSLNVRKITVFADTLADVFVNGERMTKIAEKTYSASVIVPEVEKFELTVSLSDGSIEKKFIIFPERTVRTLSVVSQPINAKIDDTSQRFCIYSRDFADGENLWKDFDVLRVTLKNTGTEPLTGLSLDIMYSLRRTTFGFSSIDSGETVTAEIPLASENSGLKVSSLIFRMSNGKSASFSVVSAMAVKKSSE